MKLRERIGRKLLAVEEPGHFASAVGYPCEAHSGPYHRPAVKRTQWHHPVVRAWQRAWTPSAPAPYPGVYAGEKLWDSRGVYLGPTCHDVTHFWIVQIMHAVADQVAKNPTLAGVPLVRAATGTFSAQQQRDPLFAMAVLSPQRWVVLGGDLKQLTDQGLWGDI